MNIGIGTKVWVWAEITGDRHAWRESEICDETPRKWVAKHSSVVIPKKDPSAAEWPAQPGWRPRRPARVAWSLEEVERFKGEARWLADAWAIGDAVRRCGDVEKLKRIAEIVGYVPREKNP